MYNVPPGGSHVLEELALNTRLRGVGLGPARLRVADVERVAGFYENVLGLTPVREGEGTALIARGSGARVLELEHAPSAPPAPPTAPGLFHLALLYPDRGALARAIEGVRDAGWPFQGFSDHAVSEAAYLADPEHNGLELYADRPRSSWERRGDELYITTEPLDLEELLARAADPPSGAGDDPVVGHVHLRVSSLDAAEAFFVGRLGFEVMVRGYPGALFVAADGYHHHLGLNVWRSRGAPPPAPGSRGLVSFTVVVESAEQRAALLDGADEGALEGPDGVIVEIRGPARS